MKQPPDPRQEPLQDDELALQRVLRALPAGEPSAKLDAAILAAASDAVGGAGTGADAGRADPGPEGEQHAAPRRMRRAAAALGWLPTWAIGTAAAAVLAIGVGVQLRPPPVGGVPAGRPVPLETEAAPAETVQFELVEPTPRPIRPTSPPPPRPQATTTRPPAAARTATPPPPPPPPPPAAMSPAPAPVADAVPQAFPELAEEEVGAFAPPPADVDAADDGRLRREAAAAEQEYARAQVRLSTAERNARDAARRDAARRAEAGAGAPERTSAATEPLPPVAADARLPPEAWIERIRERLRRGDRYGAVASLAEFRRVHPGHELPEDLARLR
ncbi:hypothetical protein [Arenimonas composti]|uniref:Uncharacterized protein n=1 Tax=Arenimonas composti TR7-09 = DSM 18010 TaxID=1121013 RepID=A0A091C2S8_9GAMM|nr:hypothetical protein [Arenimonas composti]KFN50915.1 hypothetical protein P873_00780 [Arenimonas composti TR7-09 = DSM 18010]